MDNVVTTSANPVTKPIGAETPTDALGDAKRMSTSETDGNQSDGVECPKCGRRFDTDHGFRTHFSMAHGQPVVECGQCGDDTKVRLGRLEDDDRIFCSQECAYEYRRENWSGDDHPQSRRVELSCDGCGSGYKVRPSREEISRFCSKLCKDEWQSDELRGDSSPSWRGRYEVECEVCECTFQVRRGLKNESSFCSLECKYTAHSEAMSGEGNPNYQGGRADYGGGWNIRKKEAVRERDGRECQACGMGESKHQEKFNRRHAVHHIIPARRFDNGQEANDMSNLVTICYSCHRKWEGIPLRPEVVVDE